jgi:dTDP-4-dehydrorhamnose 3,5-epimerase
MVKDLELPGLKLIELKLFHDERGFFMERFNAQRFADAGLPVDFVQDNHSRSLPGVVRGLHYQVNASPEKPGQGKLVGVLRGKIWDVVVDLRAQSPTYGKHLGIELSDSNGRLLWVPGGFAHGFMVLGNESADVLYKVDQPYSPREEGGILWSDPELGIQWPGPALIVNAKDQVLPRFHEYRANPKFK